MAIHLTLKSSPTLELEVAALNPDLIGDLSNDAIAQQPVWHGNRAEPAGDWFDVEGSATDQTVHWHGALDRVHRIAAGMTAGHVEIHGAAGRHVASGLRGGKVIAHHDVGDYCGAEMRGGLVRVRGSAAAAVGAAYPGSRHGLRGGTLIVHGNAGPQAGARMRRGLLAVGQNAGPALAEDMLAGTIVVGGSVELPLASGMRRGTIIFLSQQQLELGPCFSWACQGPRLAIQLVLRELAELDFAVPAGGGEQLKQFSGDLLEGGHGELFFAG